MRPVHDTANNEVNGLIYHMSRYQFFDWAYHHHKKNCDLSTCVPIQHNRNYFTRYDLKGLSYHENCTAIQDIYVLAKAYGHAKKSFEQFKWESIHEIGVKERLCFYSEEENAYLFYRDYSYGYRWSWKGREGTQKYVKNEAHEKKEKAPKSSKRIEKEKDYRNSSLRYSSWKKGLKAEDKVKERANTKKLIYQERYDDLLDHQGMTTGRICDRWAYD